MEPSLAQRFQSRPASLVVLLLLPRIGARMCFQIIWFIPFFVIGSTFREGYHPERLWHLLWIPGGWLLGHFLWWLSDAVAFHLNRAEARKDSRDFFLVLRPFKTTATTALPSSPETPDPIGYIFRATHSMIWQYGVALAQWGRLVAVGRVRLPKPILTNDTVSVRAKDENWIEIVRLLAKQCRAIIVLFDEGKGILQEIQHLSASGLTRKTIIRVPPVHLQNPDPKASQLRWNEARLLLEELGLHPPEPRPEGFLYIPNPDFSIQHQVSLEGGTTHALEELLKLIPPSDHTLEDAMKQVDAFERATFGN